MRSMTSIRFMVRSSNFMRHNCRHNCVQKRNKNSSAPQKSLLQQLQLDSSSQQSQSTPQSMTIGDDDNGLFTRTLITPKPFNRYHHLWLHKTITNERRIKNLPLPTPNHKKLPLIVCIMHHIIMNGPSTLESLWRGLRPLGVVKSKRRLKKSIKKYIEKYPDSLPFVNILNNSNDEEKEGNSEEIDDSDMDSDENESGSESDSDYPIDSDGFSASDSTLSTDWDSDGIQASIYGIREQKKDKIIAKYNKKWHKIEEDVANGKIELTHENASFWYYSIHENGKPVAKGPILWEGLMERLKTDKKNKGPQNQNKITNSTPVFNFAHMDHWRLLSEVIKQF